MTEKLLEGLNVETAFSVSVFGVRIDVSESVVVTWIILAVVALLSFLLTRNLKVQNIGRRQQLLETAVCGLENLIKGIVGEAGEAYVPYLFTVILYIGIANISGLFGVKPPTKDLNVTAGLALMSIVLIQVASIRAKGVGGWCKGFAKPMAIIAPLNVLELIIKPLSLCMRLFGNVLGSFVVMELIKLVIPVGVPAALSLYFDIFDGLIQAYIFVFLTGLFIKEAIE